MAEQAEEKLNKGLLSAVIVLGIVVLGMILFFIILCFFFLNPGCCLMMSSPNHNSIL